MSASTNPTALQDATTSMENIVNDLTPLVAAAVPAAAPAVAAVDAAESVTNAVEANLAHHTAVSDVAAGLTALAATPIVTSNPVIASKVTGIAALFGDLIALLKGL